MHHMTTRVCDEPLFFIRLTTYPNLIQAMLAWQDGVFNRIHTKSASETWLEENVHT